MVVCISESFLLTLFGHSIYRWKVEKGSFIPQKQGIYEKRLRMLSDGLLRQDILNHKDFRSFLLLLELH